MEVPVITESINKSDVITEFLAICDYFGITPVEFFDTKRTAPALIRQVTEAVEQLDEDDLRLTLANIQRLLK